MDVTTLNLNIVAKQPATSINSSTKQENSEGFATEFKASLMDEETSPETPKESEEDKKPILEAQSNPLLILGMHPQLAKLPTLESINLSPELLNGITTSEGEVPEGALNLNLSETLVTTPKSLQMLTTEQMTMLTLNTAMTEAAKGLELDKNLKEPSTVNQISAPLLSEGDEVKQNPLISNELQADATMTKDVLEPKKSSLESSSITSVTKEQATNQSVPMDESQATQFTKALNHQTSSVPMDESQVTQFTKELNHQTSSLPMGESQAALFTKELNHQTSSPRMTNIINLSEKTMVDSQSMTQNQSQTVEIQSQPMMYDVPKTFEVFQKEMSAVQGSLPKQTQWVNQAETVSVIYQQMSVLKENEATTLSLNLFPQHLGKLDVSLKLKNGVVDISIIVESAEIKPLIEQSVNEFSFDHMTLNKLEVEVNDQSNKRQNQDNFRNEFERNESQSEAHEEHLKITKIEVSSLHSLGRLNLKA